MNAFKKIINQSAKDVQHTSANNVSNINIEHRVIEI